MSKCLNLWGRGALLSQMSMLLSSWSPCCTGLAGCIASLTFLLPCPSRLSRGFLNSRPLSLPVKSSSLTLGLTLLHSEDVRKPLYLPLYLGALLMFQPYFAKLTWRFPSSTGHSIWENGHGLGNRSGCFSRSNQLWLPHSPLCRSAYCPFMVMEFAGATIILKEEGNN